MSKLRGGRFSLVVKLTALALVTQLVNLGVYLWLSYEMVDWSAAERVLAIGLVVSPPILIIFFLGRYIVHRTTVPLITAYTRLGGGDFEATLPLLTAGADFIGVRQAFSAMANALKQSVDALREADLDRRQLFADLAHELATPTSTLLGIAHALRRGEGDMAHLLDLLAHETARLERLIADVREVAHLEDPAMPMLFERCDLGELAQRAVDRARIAHPKTQLQCEIAAAPADADPLRFGQVLVNLIDNATRYAQDGTVAVRVRPDGDAIAIDVEDSGRGVPEELLPQLGKRLIRIDPSRSRDTGGHGLGLSIVRAIVTRHGGEITFARAGLGGLAVQIRLPAHHNNTTTRTVARS